MEKYTSRQVFTPTTPARVAFVERDDVNDKLVNALSTPGKQVVVYGHSGTGKTTLLINKLQQLYESHITTRCMKGLKFDQLILDAFDQLQPFYVSEKCSTKKTQKGIELGNAYKALSLKLNASVARETAEKESRVLPPQLTPQALGRFLGHVNACWVIEDFHKIDAAEKQKLSQLMKVFMDLSDEYPELKIVALGAVETARQVVEYDPEMRNRVAEIHVTLMTEHEIAAIIKKGEAALNIKFTPEISSVVSKHSNGLASVCHHLCLNMCDAAGIHETVQGKVFNLTKAHCEQAVKTYVDEASDSIKSAFGKALKQRRKNEYNNAEVILQALCTFRDGGAARYDLHRRILQENSAYPERNLKSCLPKLCTGEYGAIIRYDANSGMYSFSDPIYRAYALAMYQKLPRSNSTSDFPPLPQDFEEILLSLLRDKIKIDAPKTIRRLL